MKMFMLIFRWTIVALPCLGIVIFVFLWCLFTEEHQNLPRWLEKTADALTRFAKGKDS